MAVPDVDASNNEGGLRADMIARIRDIGGTVAVGTSSGDMREANAATGNFDPATGVAWKGIYAQHVANNCAGSSRSFAQGYLYTLRKMNGRGLTLGTDINGLEAQVNPRFGTQGCYARGNIPWSVQIAQDSANTFLVNDTSQVPFNFRPDILWDAAGGTAGEQRLAQRQSSAGLNYKHYGGSPPAGNRFSGLSDPAGYAANMDAQQFAITSYGTVDPTSMSTLASAIPPLNAHVTGNRTFDLNYDGLAQYGMLPDLLQDTRVVGMTSEQLGPLFQGAEALIQTWEKGCGLSAPLLSGPGCLPSPEGGAPREMAAPVTGRGLARQLMTLERALRRASPLPSAARWWKAHRRSWGDALERLLVPGL
jgi:hypothetical protein